MKSFLDLQTIRLTQTQAKLSTRLRRYGWVALVMDSFLAFQQHESTLLAAALSYYALLSLFPLLLMVIGFFSLFLQTDEVVNAILQFTRGFVPVGTNEVRQVVRQALEARGAVEVLAAVGFAWSVSGVFDLIQRGFNRAWRVTEPPPAWRARLLSLGMVLSFALLFGISMAFSGAMRTLARLEPATTAATRYLLTGGTIGSVIVSILVFAIVYRVGTHRPILWRDVWVGALVSGILWELSKTLFAWYVLYVAHLNLVYGSIGAVIVLLLWGYISGAILLYGAELNAARWRKRKETL